MPAAKSSDGGDALIDLHDFVAAVRRDLGGGEECVLVDPDQHVVASFREYGLALDDFYARLDTDPGAALKLGVYKIGRDELIRTWPDAMTPLQRARVLADAGVDFNRAVPGLDGMLRSQFLRGDHGTAQIGDETRAICTVWWPDEAGVRQHIGYFLEGHINQQTGVADWELLVGREPFPPAPDLVETRLADVLNANLPDEWPIDVKDIRACRKYRRPLMFGQPREHLLRLTVAFAEEFRLLDPNGPELQR